MLCGRNKDAFNNGGNKRFRVTVSLYLDCFMGAKSRKEKNTVIKSILKIVESNGGKFLEFKKNLGLVELSTKKAHTKVGHALRDMALAARKGGGCTKKNGVARAATLVTTIVPSVAVTIEDPFDILLESITTEDVEAFDPTPQDAEANMLHWLVGESNGLLGDINMIAAPMSDSTPSAAVVEEEFGARRSSISMDDDLVSWLVGENFFV